MRKQSCQQGQRRTMPRHKRLHPLGSFTVLGQPTQVRGIDGCHASYFRRARHAASEARRDLLGLRSCCQSYRDAPVPSPLGHYRGCSTLSHIETARVPNNRNSITHAIFVKAFRKYLRRSFDSHAAQQIKIGEHPPGAQTHGGQRVFGNRDRESRLFPDAFVQVLE